MEREFSKEAEERFQQLLTRYPREHRRAALLPSLYIAQEEFGYLSVEAMSYVAKRLDLPEAEVLQVATFYSLYHKRPAGQYTIQVCVSISCALAGAHRLIHHLEETLKVKVGETTADGVFTLDEAECLASCGTAPVLQVNREYHENMTNEKVDALLRTLRERR